MNQEINLLTDLQAKNRRAKTNLWRLIIFSLVFASIILVVWAWLWSSSIILNRRDAVVKSNIDSTQSQIKSEAQIEQRQVLLTDRLNSVSGILAKRPKLAERLKKLLAIFPENVQIDGAELSGNSLLELKVSMTTYDKFAECLKVLQTSDILASVSLDQTSRKADGTYALTLSIQDK